MAAIFRFLKREKLLVLLIIAAFILKLFFLAKWMDDWDSIQFALGLHEYSLPKHQPHPPGYPLYILLGRFFLLIFRNDTLALTGLSAFFGALGILPLYLLIKKIFNDQKLAVFGSIIFITTPVVWLLSETALSDVVGLFFLILTSFLLYIFKDQSKKIIWVSFLAGLSIGVRFNEFPIILGLLFWVMLKQRNLKSAILQFISIGIGILIWLVPMILLTGWSQFYQTFTDNGSYVASHDLLLGASHSFLGLLKAKALLLVPLFKLGYTIPFTILFLVCLIGTFFQKKLFKENWYQFCLIWLISYFVLLFSFYNLELPRHIMPLVVPMILITTYMLGNLIKRNKFSWIIPAALVVVLAMQGYSQVSRFHNSLPATVASVLYVKSHYQPKDTVVYASNTLRNFEYYAPEFKIFDSKGDKSIITPDKTIILDHIDLKKDPALQDYKEVDTQYFSGDKDIYPKVDSIELHIMKYQK